MQASDARRVQREKLMAYLARPSAQAPTDEKPLKRLTRRILPPPMRPFVAQVATDALRPRERRRARGLGRSPLLLHLGSAASVKPGWVNIDLAGHPTELAWNLRRPLPFPSATVEAVFHEHVLEHFSLADGVRLLDDCFRVLRPGGVLRVGVPDAGAYAHSYTRDGDGIIESERPGRPTPMIALAELFYSHGHKWMYDAETLAYVMSVAGFTNVFERPFGESAISPAPDSPPRRAETVYVEGTR
jgi:predicted SAM-dependent methyltransferase